MPTSSSGHSESPLAGTEASPLSEASPRSLDEYFSRHPKDLTDEQLTVVVQELRRARAAWEKAEAAGAKRPTKAARTPPPANLGRDITLDDLEL